MRARRPVSQVMRRFALVFLLFVNGLAASATAQVFSGHSADGTVVLANFRGPETPTLLMPSGTPTGSGATVATSLGSQMRAQSFSALLADVAREVDLPVGLLHAVISVESGYIANAVSPKGAKGLMQLMPATARRFGVADPFEPRDNVRAGARYLKWLLQRFEGDLELALAAYNAGEDAVVRAGYRVPAFAETLQYVPRVLARMQTAPGT